MNYALIEDGIVTNLIWINPGNAADFPTAVPVGEYAVLVGDEYSDGKFYRSGELLESRSEQLEKLLVNLIGGVEDVQS